MFGPQVILQFGQGTVDFLAVSARKVILGEPCYDIFQPRGLFSGTEILNASILSQLAQLKMHFGQELTHLSLRVRLLLS